MNLYESEKDEIDLDECIRVLPSGRFKRWLQRLKEYNEFVTRCYKETKEENEVLREQNADLTIQLANAKSNNLST